MPDSNTPTMHAESCRVLDIMRAYKNHPAQVPPRDGVDLFHTALPPEIIDWMHSFFEDDRHAFVALSRVCRLWRDLVYGSPVWATCERVHHASTASLMPATYEWPFELVLPYRHSEAVTILSELGPKIHFLVVGFKWKTIVDFARSGCHSVDWIAQKLRKFAWRVNVHCRVDGPPGTAGVPGLYNNVLSMVFHMPNVLHGKLPLSRIVFMKLTYDFWGQLADIVRNRRSDFPLTSVELLWCEELTDISCLADVRHVRALACRRLTGLRGLTGVRHLEVDIAFESDPPYTEVLHNLLAAAPALETLQLEIDATASCHSGCPHDLSHIFGDVLLAAQQRFAVHLTELHLSHIAVEHLRPLANARGLRRVSITGASQLKDLGALQQLEALSLDTVGIVDFTTLFPESTKPSPLRRLEVQSCSWLKSFEGLRRASALEELRVGCDSDSNGIRSMAALYFPTASSSQRSHALLDILPALSASLRNFELSGYSNVTLFGRDPVSNATLFCRDPVTTKDEICAWRDRLAREASPRGDGFKLTLRRCRELAGRDIMNLLHFVEMCLEPLEELHMRDMPQLTGVLECTTVFRPECLARLTRASFVDCDSLTNVRGLQVIPELDLNSNGALCDVAILGTGRVRALNLWNCHSVTSVVGLHTIHALTLSGTGISTISPLLGWDSVVKILDVRDCDELWGDAAEMAIEASGNDFYCVRTSGYAYEPDETWSDILAHA